MIAISTFVAFGLAASSFVFGAPTKRLNDDILASSNEYPTYNISAPDGSIKASFIPLGATITHLYIKDRNAKWRDVILGYDYTNTSAYETDPAHPFFGALVGRYANRIKNSTFTIPPTASSLASDNNMTTYHITPNENDGKDTLHGGTPGYDRRVFEVENRDDSSIEFTLDDPDGSQGFPGRVLTKAKYTLLNGSKWHLSFTSNADASTPIMLLSHTYFNLDAYGGDDSSSYNTSSALDHHHLEMDAGAIIDTDSILIPTGQISTVEEKPAYDFRKEHIISKRFDQTLNGCGGGCTGYDNCFILNKKDDNEKCNTVLSLWSDLSGIKLSLETNQEALQIYTCNSVYKDTAIPRKSTQRSADDSTAIYDNHSCVVIEPESWIDGINYPEWPINQIYGPEREYVFDALYTFSII